MNLPTYESILFSVFLSSHPGDPLVEDAAPQAVLDEDLPELHEAALLPELLHQLVVQSERLLY